jgi:hypothetical protein
MPRSQDNLAAYYRAHREAMELALATGCTPREAERELRRRAKARRAACGTRAADPAPEANFEPMDRDPEDYRDWDARWMMRD